MLLIEIAIALVLANLLKAMILNGVEGILFRLGKCVGKVSRHRLTWTALSLLLSGIVFWTGLARAADRIDVLPTSFGVSAFKSNVVGNSSWDRQGYGLVLEGIYKFNPFIGVNIGAELGFAQDRHATYDFTPAVGSRLQVSDVEFREFYGKLRPGARITPLSDKTLIRPFIGAGLSFQGALLSHSDPRTQSSIAAEALPSSYHDGETLRSAAYFGEAGVEVGSGKVALRLVVSRELPLNSPRAETLGNNQFATQDTRAALTLVFRH